MKNLTLFLFAICCFIGLKASDFEDRKNQFIDGAINKDGLDPAILKAYRNLPVEASLIEDEMANVSEEGHLDFKLIKIMRLMYLTDGEFDDIILDALEGIPFWLPDPENLREYWSENHMIMWMSANWLLHEKHDWEARPTLRQNIVHYLDLKNEYGYYEFFSPVYAKFTITALFNLADFAEDEEISTKAASAVQRLLSELLLFATDDGIYYPVAGRAYPEHYDGSRYDRAIYLLTGNGSLREGTTNVSVAIATTSVDLSGVSNSWSPEENLTLDNGHTLLEGKREINNTLTREDRIVFQWSSGAYFHPHTAEDMLWQLGNYDMWDHRQFQSYSDLSWLPPSIGSVAATFAGSISRSSYIGKAEIDIYKNHGVVLTSLQNYWKGRLGYQQWPWVATCGDQPVFTRSGNVGEGGFNEDRSNNTTLPYLEQDGNVALIMYRANWDLPIFGYDDFDIWTNFPKEEFDEIREFDNWVLGRVAESYVALKKHCEGTINGVDACDDQDGQTWAIVVGNEETHTSFNHFADIIGEATYEERWYFKWRTFEWVYYGHINVDGKDIDHHWKGNILSGPSNGNRETLPERAFQLEAENIHIFPNPAKDYFSLDLRSYEGETRSISVINMAGQIVYSEYLVNQDSYFKSIPTLNWSNGVYTVIIENTDGTANIKRLIVQQ